jgi:hypothetical protein
MALAILSPSQTKEVWRKHPAILPHGRSAVELAKPAHPVRQNGPQGHHFGFPKIRMAGVFCETPATNF